MLWYKSNSGKTAYFRCRRVTYFTTELIEVDDYEIMG